MRINTPSETRAFYRIKLFPSQIYLLPGEKGFLLVDAGPSRKVAELLRFLRARGISPGAIKYILLTHHHEDHVGAAASLAEITGAKLIVHRAAEQALSEGRVLSTGRPANGCVRLVLGVYAFFQGVRKEFEPIRFSRQDVLLEGDDDEFLPSIGIRGRILHTPGHTRDSLSVVLEDGSAFVGDAASSLFRICGSGFLPPLIEDSELLKKSWAKLLQAGARVIYPSHGPPFPAQLLFKRIIKSGWKPSGP